MPETILFDEGGNPLSEGDIVIWNAPDDHSRLGCVCHFGPCLTRDNGAYNPGGLSMWYFDTPPHPQAQETRVRRNLASTALRDTSGVTRIEAWMLPERADEINELVRVYELQLELLRKEERGSKDAVMM